MSSGIFLRYRKKGRNKKDIIPSELFQDYCTKDASLPDMMLECQRCAIGILNGDLLVPVSERMTLLAQLCPRVPKSLSLKEEEEERQCL